MRSILSLEREFGLLERLAFGLCGPCFCVMKLQPARGDAFHEQTRHRGRTRSTELSFELPYLAENTLPHAIVCARDAIDPGRLGTNRQVTIPAPDLGMLVQHRPKLW